MKTKINIFATLLLAFAAFVACTKDDKTFKGTDNYIISLTVEKNGVKYAALITDDAIQITAPDGVDLSNAKVEYHICELATISPDPSTITDWNSAMQITVTSHNKSTRNYQYSVSRTDLVETETVILRTQAEVDAFASKGISRIDGSLILGDVAGDESKSITDLSALSALEEVTGNIIVKNSFNAENLNGLQNLKSVGNIYIGTSSSAAALYTSVEVNLPSLEKIGEFVVNDPQVKAVKIPALRSAWTIFINTKSASEWSLDALKNIYGDIVLQSGTNNSASTVNTKLKTVVINKLESIVGSLTIQGLTETSTINLSSLHSVGGNLTFAYLTKMSELNVDLLSSVGGKITLSNLNAYAAVEFPQLLTAGSIFYTGTYSSRPEVTFSMASLEKIADDFEINYAAPQTLSLESLTSIGGQLKLNYCETITSISVPKLASCPTIYLSNIPLLTSANFSQITNLDAVTFITPTNLTDLKLPTTIGSLVMNGGSNATTMPSFIGLEQITKNFQITNYKATDMIIDNIKHIGTFSQNDGSGQKTLSFTALETIDTLSFSLTDLVSLSAPKLTKAKFLDFQNFWALTNVNLSSLIEVTDELKLWGASYSGNAKKCLLVNLDFLSSLTKIGSVNIKWCGNLTDYSGLKNAINSLTVDTWSVSECLYNPTYKNMLDGEYIKQ